MNGGSFRSGRSSRVSSIRSLRPSGPVDGVDVVSSSSRFSISRSACGPACRGFRNERHRRPEARWRQALLDRFQQVVRLQLLDLQVGVADDAEGVDPEQVHLRGRARRGWRRASARARHRRWARPRPSWHVVAGQRHQARQHVGHLDAREVAPPFRVCSSTARFRLRLEICGNGWPGSTASGRADREDHALEIVAQARSCCARSSSA